MDFLCVSVLSFKKKELGGAALRGRACAWCECVRHAGGWVAYIALAKNVRLWPGTTLQAAAAALHLFDLAFLTRDIASFVFRNVNIVNNNVEHKAPNHCTVYPATNVVVHTQLLWLFPGGRSGFCFSCRDCDTGLCRMVATPIRIRQQSVA